MRIEDRIAALRSAGEEAAWRIRTVGRVAAKTGLIRSIRLPGAKALVSELVRAKGKVDPSLLFHYLAANDPNRAALVALSAPPGGGVVEERAYSFHEMNDRIDRLASALHASGVKPGSRVLVMLKNRPEFVLLQLAAGRIGCGAVSCSYRSAPRELEYMVNHSGAKAVFFDVDAAATVREAMGGLRGVGRERCVSVGGEAEGFPSIDAFMAGARGAPPRTREEAAVVMYTSGTTGKPKGAVRRYASGATVAALAFLGETPLEMGEVHLAVCPLYHATAFGFVSFSYLLGSTVLVLREFRPEAFLAAIERYRVTTTAVVPTMLHRLVELGPEVVRRYDTSSLKAIFTGGAPLSAPLATEFMNLFGDKLFNFYGATETGVVTCASPADLRAAPGTIGRAVPGNDVRLFDERGRVCQAGEVGELYVKSPMLIDGYHADEEGTRASMRDGYFSVGDLARQDARGYFFIEGRKRDMIISGGVNVYPAEVEGALHEHPAVAEAAVVGVPDPEWGERVRAFIALKPGAEADEDALKAHCRMHLAGPKVPRDFVFLAALPRNPTGKVLKRELRAM
ncbi:class I adenylate-forming enzyme family protein [Polyangium aurulentum]|uniref:class I adenylate-forming enzyme family protein n=1 Tax=Polyangium aurulentum TaxID=2567896 RepID=UPI0010AE0EB5|nr:AMP-binding protein [Polyangium aurulentum]UQA60150.1 AMP-binding protein [Polyangium aurulentum]